MSLLFRVVYAKECSSTHHKLALDALTLLENDQAEAWQNVFLKHFDRYLDGAKAPDKRFRDFRNHVLHVRDDEWGGEIKLTRKWYDQMVDDLRNRRWSKAVFAAGVTSHYYSDPIHPFHTGQSEEEGVIHRAVEWSCTKSYDLLRELLLQQLGGFPKLRPHNDTTWLEEMVREGARFSNQYYETILDHYNFEVGRRRPPEGLDDTLREIFAKLIGHAAAGTAAILDRGFAEAEVQPPGARIGWLGYLAAATAPASWFSRRRVDRSNRKTVGRMYREYQRTGKVIKTLPPDDRAVRALHAEEVLQIPLQELDALEIRPLGTQHVPIVDPANEHPERTASTAGSRASGNASPDKPGDSAASQSTDASKTAAPNSGSASSASADDGVSNDRPQTAGEANSSDASTSWKIHLKTEDPIVDAPSIGPKTARVFRKRAGIKTVGQFLEADAEDLAPKLKLSYADSNTLRQWQAQAKLVCTVPNLRGHDAAILVACDFERPEDLASVSCEDLLPIVQEFCRTSEGQRILRSGKMPDQAEVADWIEASRAA